VFEPEASHLVHFRVDHRSTVNTSLLLTDDCFQGFEVALTSAVSRWFVSFNLGHRSLLAA